MPPLSTIILEAPQVAPTIFAFDFLRYVIGAGGVFLLVNGLFSGLLKGRRIRDRHPATGQIRRELLTSFRTILIFSGMGFLIWLGLKLGVVQMYEHPGARGWVWFVLSLAILIAGHDAWFYWTHRIIHHPRLFRRLHRTHHRSNLPTPFTAYAFDTGEAVINALYLLVAVIIVPVSELAVFIFTAHMMIRNAIGHCGYEVFPRTRTGRPLFDWMTTVTHHDLHHAEAGWNYGLYFTFWDRLMGTEHPEYYKRFLKAVRPNRQDEQTSRPLEPA